jgi:hypothetical protein
MAASDRYASFLVRLWSTQHIESPTNLKWQGEIQHIQSGRHWSFLSMDELLDFLRHHSERDALNEPDHGREAE